MPALFAQLEFEYPGRLLWLAVLPVVLYFAVRSQSTIAVWRRYTSTACRILLISVLVIAFAGLVRRTQSDRQFIVFINDTSQSIGSSRRVAEEFIGAATAASGEHTIAFLNFAAKPGNLRTTPDFGFEQTSGSDPAAAVRFASASIPDDFVPKMVLLSDAIATDGDLLRVVTGSRIPIAVVPLEAFPEAEVCVRELFAPAMAPPQSDVTIEAVIDSNRQQMCYLETRRDGQSIDRRRSELEAGENRVRLPVEFAANDQSVYEVRVIAEGDTIPANNSRRAMVFAGPRTKILLVGEGNADGSLARLLSQRGFAVESTTVDRISTTVEDLLRFDAVILSNITTNQLDADRADALEKYVHDFGGGLITLGGEQTFGEVAFRDSRLERLLPVKATEVVEARKKVLAIALVIDRSSSMTSEGEDRIRLAKDAAKQSVAVLEPQDKIGIIAFSNEPEWVAEMSPCDDKSLLLEQIETLTAYGQTHMYPAVERALLALQQTDADRRHMIILTDGIPAPGDYDKIARKMAESGITLTTVTMGNGAEQNVMRDMADIAKGKFHHCANSNELPSIIEKETRAASSNDGPASFQAFTLRQLPGLEVSGSPPLSGYAPTSPKPNTELLLVAAGGDPLLSWWRYGQGITVALTTDLSGQPGKAWRDWSGQALFWQRLVEHARRRPTGQLMDVSLRRFGENGIATIDAIDSQRHFVNGARVVVTVQAPDSSRNSLVARQVAPGRYEARFPMPTVGRYLATVELDGGQPNTGEVDIGSGETQKTQRAVFVDYDEELQIRSTATDDLKLVASTTGGIYQPQPSEIFAADGRSVEVVTSLWTLLVSAALVLFIADVMVRRLR